MDQRLHPRALGFCFRLNTHLRLCGAKSRLRLCEVPGDSPAAVAQVQQPQGVAAFPRAAAGFEQDQESWKRYAGDEHLSPFDPGIQSEAVGDADPVAATGLGYRSLRQVARHLVTAASATGDDFSELRHFYDALVGQWFLETQHVTRLIGGNRRRIKHAGQAGVVFTPVDGSTQRRALDFLLNQSLQYTRLRSLVLALMEELHLHGWQDPESPPEDSDITLE